MASVEAPTKFSEYTIPEVDESVFHPRPIAGVPPIAGGNVPGHKTDFSSLSSQMTIESQQMLTPYSQQQMPSQQHQQQQQHLDKLSMDVMLHTQLSGTSFQGGITSLIPKARNIKVNDGKPHLDRADLKELEMDEIDLEKQRIKLMLYEQQKQEKESEGQGDVPSHTSNEQQIEVLEDAEKDEHCLSIEQLRQELESLDQIVSDQKKKYRETKMAREREEQNLRQAEKELDMERINPNDQQQWHIEQKRRLREREKLKSKQNELLQHLQYNEHRAKNKLKAIEAQAADIREQLQKVEAAVAATAQQNVQQEINSHSPTQAKHSSGSFKGGYDMFPSKLTSNDRQRMDKRTDEPSAAASCVIKWDLDGSKSTPAHAISCESMSTAISEQPELNFARELATTISESLLTEPTQDDPAPTKWPPSSFGSRPVSGGLLPSDDFFSTKSHSRNTLITEPDDIFLNQEKRLQQRDHPPSMAGAVDTMESSLPPLRCVPNERDFTHGQQMSRGYRPPGDEAQQLQQPTAFRHAHRLPAQQNQVAHSTEPAWSSISKQVGGGGEREMIWSEQAATHYDVPASVRAAYQHQQLQSNRQHSRHQKSRGTSGGRNQTPSGMAVADLPSLDRPVQDAPRLVNGATTGAPDVIPVSYSPASPHGHLHTSPTSGMQQRHVTGSESVTGVAGPPRSPNYPIYDVPPSPSEREPKLTGIGYNPVPSSPVALSHQQKTVMNFPLQHQMNINSHMTGHVTSSSGMPPSSPVADNIYDQPRSTAVRSSHSFRSTATNGPLYDIPASARRSAGFEGGVAIIKQDSQRQSPSLLVNHPAPVDHGVPPRGGEKSVHNLTPVLSKSKPISSHRYGISKPGMGHSYSRGRPDHMQQIDKAKQYMDSRSYRNQGGVRHPERIQRQQTDL